MLRLGIQAFNENSPGAQPGLFKMAREDSAPSDPHERIA
jgi:hypothetical protein